MNAVIASIKVNRRQSKLYSVYINLLPEPLEIHEDIFIKYQLSKGQGLTSSLIDEIREENAKYMAYIKAVRYLAARASSSKQLAVYLKKQEFSGESIDAAIARLLEEGYVDDEQYASRYASSRIGKQGKGKLRIAQELKMKGISSSIIQETLAEVDDDIELNGAYEAAKKKQRSLHGEENEIRQKLLLFLLRRGYSRAISREAMKMLEKEEKNSSDEG